MGVAAAIAGSAVIGAGASIYSSSKASSAASKAADANNALETQIYNQNRATLSPFVSSGTAATSAIDGLLGIGSAAPGATDWAKYVESNPDLSAEWNRVSSDPTFGGDIANYGQWHYDTYGKNEGRDITPYTNSATGSGATDAQTQAFDNFRNSSGYQFQYDQGLKAVQSALGSKGYLDSGAAIKSALKYGQGVADSSLQTYLGDLTGQQTAGLTAASAQAGVGQGYANATSANNNSAANTSANASLATGGAVNSALGSALSAYALNSALGSSYGGTSLTAPTGVLGSSAAFTGGKSIWGT